MTTTEITKMSLCHLHQGTWEPERESYAALRERFRVNAALKEMERSKPKRGGSIKPMNWTVEERRNLNAWRRDAGGFSIDRGGYRSTNIESLRA